MFVLKSHYHKDVLVILKVQRAVTLSDRYPYELHLYYHFKVAPYFSAP